MTARPATAGERSDRRERLLALVRPFPEVEISGGPHLAFRVRKKVFGYYLVDHHGDGRLGLCCKAYPGGQPFLVGQDPAQFYVPAYLGARGWVGLRLDLATVDWAQAAKLLSDSYRQLAPKALAAQLAAPAPAKKDKP